MQIYSNMTMDDVRACVPEGLELQETSAGNYVLRSLTARHVPSHFAGGRVSHKRTRVATYDEHGTWMARVFAHDPDARIKSTFADYRGATSFHMQTYDQFHGA